MENPLVNLGVSGLAVVASALLLITGCAPGSAPRTTSDSQATQSRSPKVLTVGIFRELDAWNTDLIRVTRGGGISTLNSLAHNKLTIENEYFVYVPELAALRGSATHEPDATVRRAYDYPEPIVDHHVAIEQYKQRRAAP